jgi:hypothetical protein
MEKKRKEKKGKKLVLRGGWRSTMADLVEVLFSRGGWVILMIYPAGSVRAVAGVLVLFTFPFSSFLFFSFLFSSFLFSCLVFTFSPHLSSLLVSSFLWLFNTPMGACPRSCYKCFKSCVTMSCYLYF